MGEFLSGSVYFGVGVSVLGYLIGEGIQKKIKRNFFNPLLFSILFVMGILFLCKIDYKAYQEGASYLSYLLTPATVCLAVPLYHQLELLKKNKAAILAGSIAGVLSSLCSILLLSFLLGLEHAQYVTLLPKSITTAIGMGVSEELGGIPNITASVIIITGIFGSVSAKGVCRIFRIKEPIAVGLAMGTAAHAVGTAKAMELGEIEGAMSSLAVVVSGLLTVVGASVFANFL